MAGGCEAEPAGDASKLIRSGLADHLHGPSPPSLVDLEAELREHRGGVAGHRSVGLDDAVERLPVGAQPRHRVDGGELDDDAERGVLPERGGEAGEVGDVVRDVVADGHVRPRGVGCDVGPGALDRGGFDREAEARSVKASSIAGLGSTPITRAAPRRRLAAPAPTPTSSTTPPTGSASRATSSEGVSSPRLAASSAASMNTCGSEVVRRFGRDRDEVVGNRPAGQHLGPPSVGAARLDHAPPPVRVHGRSGQSLPRRPPRTAATGPPVTVWSRRLAGRVRG